MLTSKESLSYSEISSGFLYASKLLLTLLTGRAFLPS